MKKLTYFFVVAACITALTVLIFRPEIRIVSAHSMHPTLIPGDVVLCITSLPIGYGDVVLLENFENNQDLVKRVIAVPGDHVEFSKKEFYINGQKLEKELIRKLPLKSITDLAFRQTVAGRSFEIYESYFDFLKSADAELKKDEYFLVGDNRDFSVDSRDFGPVKRQNLGCRIIAIIGTQTDDDFHYARQKLL